MTTNEHAQNSPVERAEMSTRPTRPAWRWPLVVAVVAGVLAVGTVLLSRGGGRVAGPPDDGQPGVSHVHGLGINPSDDALIVATHYGTFRMPDDGDVERLGQSYQDTMGFTVAGPDRFLGSGHPDMAGLADGQPTRLGLIESTDAGETWSSLSLGGEADFHGLAIAGDRVYGWDSGTGRFMVTTDRVEWETLSTLDLLAFAVDPDDPDHLIGASPDGVIETTDGGRTWKAEESPSFVAVSWDEEAGIWGVDASGQVWRRTDDAWDEAGQLDGEPHAFLATADRLYAATVDDEGVTSIYESAVESSSWTLRYRDAA